MGNIFQKLATKVLKGSATEAEQHFIDTYYDAFDELKDREDALTTEAEAALRNHIHCGIQTHIQQKKTISFRKWLPYVAAIAVFALLTGMWVFFSAYEPTPTHHKLMAEEVFPGSNRATLTLADGKTIDLKEDQGGIVVSNNVIYLDGSSVLSERVNEGTTEEAYSHVQAHTLTTPKGGTYQITLSDGSQIWLNAGSTFKYPIHFSDDERTVELSGEGYFAIAKDETRPFRVRTNGQEVEVLGTEFNISAYPDEQTTKTTLVEGSVQVLNLNTQISKPLVSGEQSVITGNTMTVSPVRVAPYTSWKDGYFYFDHVPPQEAIEQIARWYNLEVVYEGTAPKTAVFGMVERTKPLSAILNSLGKSGLRFEVRQIGTARQLKVIGT